MEERVNLGYVFWIAVHWKKPVWTQTRWEPGGGSWCRDHAGVLLTGLLSKTCSNCFLIQPRTQRCTEVAGPTVDCTAPYQSLRKNMPHRWASGDLMEEILQLIFAYSLTTFTVSSWHKLTSVYIQSNSITSTRHFPLYWWGLDGASFHALILFIPHRMAGFF